MDTLPLPQDFREFLRLLNSEKIEYLIVGGYAVAHHGYARPTGDLDVWVGVDPESASKLAGVLKSFGFATPTVRPDLFLTAGRVVRMGVPPVRIEILTEVSGVAFSECHARRVEAEFDGIPVRMIAKTDLLANKRAAGRHKDLNDLKHLDGGL
ncbi:MAG: hypothetical protein HOP29_14755 [Phycisphaerales bacterium]|nr:hypothetical protein [Phycisphaerales bacterium]